MRYFTSLIVCLLSLSLSAQNVGVARKHFAAGEYDRAKPMFQQLVKQQPSSANYNYWYGVCCVKTNDAAAAIKPLEFALKRKVPNAARYLAEAYEQLYDMDQAVQYYQLQIDESLKKNQSVADLEKRMAFCKMQGRMLKGVENVCFIDSFVVAKAGFLQAYHLSEESGSLYTYDDFFHTQHTAGTVYETQLSNKLYYAEMGADSTLNIMIKSKLADEWSAGKPLPESINANVNANYPFVSTDGLTVYYAADGAQSLGGYDIFVTRYNVGTEGYLMPENIGMPFNSSANDYMYVIDEYNNLGWFATDRGQPTDSVCIYVFIPNVSRVSYNYEAMSLDSIARLAQLKSIRDTWTDIDLVDAAKARLQKTLHQRAQPKSVPVSNDFSFIIDDTHTYHKVKDFTSSTARSLFEDYQQCYADYNERIRNLNAQRERYSEASNSEKAEMSALIINLERNVRELSEEITNLATKIRNLEIRELKSNH